MQFYKLLWEYRHPKILADIARVIGIPLKIDRQGEGGVFHYARVLIEVDISVILIDSLMIERVGKSFFIEISYDNLPSILFDLFIYWASP